MMLLEEAMWIADQVAGLLETGAVSSVIDLGSSTEEFRRLDQPYIDYYIFLPLRRAEVAVIHVDARAAEGVDVVADVTDPSVDLLQRARPADLVFCTNL